VFAQVDAPRRPEINEQGLAARFEKLNVKIKGILDETIKGDFTKLRDAVVPE